MADTLLRPASPTPASPPPVTGGTAGSARRPGRRGRGSRYLLRTIALAYVALLVLVPLVVVVWRTWGQGLGQFTALFADPDAVHAFVLTGEVAGIAVVVNTVFGLGVSLLLARFRFPGRRLLDVLIDVPVAVSPIVVGLAIILVYGSSTGWFGTPLESAGIQIVYAVPGMVMATAFVSLPLVVREVLPVLQELGVDQEQAARSLGAGAWQRFARITLPGIRAGLLYGVVLSLARSLGEFGAVRVVSGGIIGQTQTVTQLVDERAEQFEPGAYQASLVLIAVAVLVMVVVSLTQHRSGRSEGRR